MAVNVELTNNLWTENIYINPWWDKFTVFVLSPYKFTILAVIDRSQKTNWTDSESERQFCYNIKDIMTE